MTPAGPARVHSTLLAADALQTAGNQDEATKRLDQAARTSSSDVRASTFAQATRALGRGRACERRAATSGCEARTSRPWREAVQIRASAPLRLQGDRAEGQASPQEPSPNEITAQGAPGDPTRGDLVAAVRPSSLGGSRQLASQSWRAGRRGSSRASLGATRRGGAAARRSAVATASAGARGRRGEAVAPGAGPRARRPRPHRRGHPWRRADRGRAGASVDPRRRALLPADDPHLEATASAAGMAPLAAAAAALTVAPPGEAGAAQAAARALRTAGSAESRGLIRLGRLLGVQRGDASEDIEQRRSRLSARPGPPLPELWRWRWPLEQTRARGEPRARGDQRAGGMGRRKSAHSEERAIAAIAAALVAERSGNRVTGRSRRSRQRRAAHHPTNELRRCERSRRTSRSISCRSSARWPTSWATTRAPPSHASRAVTREKRGSAARAHARRAAQSRAHRCPRRRSRSLRS